MLFVVGLLSGRCSHSGVDSTGIKQERGVVTCGTTNERMGKVDQAKGQVKHLVGTLTGNDDLNQ